MTDLDLGSGWGDNFIKAISVQSSLTYIDRISCNNKNRHSMTDINYTGWENFSLISLCHDICHFCDVLKLTNQDFQTWSIHWQLIHFTSHYGPDRCMRSDTTWISGDTWPESKCCLYIMCLSFYGCTLSARVEGGGGGLRWRGEWPVAVCWHIFFTSSADYDPLHPLRLAAVAVRSMAHVYTAHYTVR